MGNTLETFGLQLGQGAIGSILGLAMADENDRRQIRQQEKLQKLQIAGNKQMGDYNYKKQLEMWNATNYGPQMKQLEAAGLNPGLIYGMGGGGGQTTGGGYSGSVSGANAPSGGGEAMGIGMAAAQMGLLQAQKKNIEADTQNKLAEIPGKEKEPGLKQAQTDSLTQGIQNQKAQEELTKIQSGIAGLEARLKGETLEASVDIIKSEQEAWNQRLMQMEQQTILDRTTRIQKAEIIRQESIGAYLNNLATQSGMEVNRAQISKWANEVAQGWQNLTLQEKRLKVEGIMKEVEAFNTGMSQGPFKIRMHKPESVAEQIDQILGTAKSDFEEKPH